MLSHDNRAVNAGSVFFSIVLCAGALLGSVPAAAQDAAPKLVRIVVPFSAGASNDAIARAIAGPVGKRLDSTVIVENRPGAAGAIGADAVAKSPRDGSVLLLTSSTFLTAAATQPRLSYDPIAAFAPVAVVGQNPSLLAVSSSTPFKSPAELLAAARAKPGELTYGSAGVGSIGHMATELLSAAAKVQMRHVPYKGAANAAIDLAGGQIHVMVSSYSTLGAFLKSGKVRALAVTSKQPYPAFPDLPPLIATVPGFWNETWVGVFAPAGTPARFIERLNQELNEISASPELRALLEPDGMMAVALTPASFAARLKQEFAQWKQIAMDRKIVVE
ncbi:MAG TPA: tripartite tricarboxylate transporter substrate-binding protein [Burkholderiales bacterium]|nr:tripartite tricarboxylate transporter substrate-binding protein [Burkholderiales bacterium]